MNTKRVLWMVLAGGYDCKTPVRILEYIPHKDKYLLRSTLTNKEEVQACLAEYSNFSVMGFLITHEYIDIEIVNK